MREISKQFGLHYTEQSLDISSPYPPPAYIDTMEKHCLGATDRLITMVENEQEFKHSITQIDIKEYYGLIHEQRIDNKQVALRSQLILVVLVVIFAIVTVVLACFNYPGALWPFGILFAGIIGIFLWGKFQSFSIGGLQVGDGSVVDSEKQDSSSSESGSKT